jgi:hypothetical protein
LAAPMVKTSWFGNFPTMHRRVKTKTIALRAMV